jgi:mannosyltransferase
VNSPSPVPRWLPAAIVVLGAALRLHGLGVHSFWYDEAASVAVATAADPFAALRGDRHPPLFFVLLRAWHAVVGSSDEWLRVLPAVFGIASLAGMHAIARRVLAPGAAVLATALFAVAPYQIWYCQELRMYSLLELGTVVALLGAVASEWHVAARAVALAAGGTIALGSHYFGFLVPALAAPFVWHAVLPEPGGVRRWRTVLLIGAPAVGMVPWLPWLLTMVPEQLRTTWGVEARLAPRELLELPVRMFVVIGKAMPAAVPIMIAVWVVGALLVAPVSAWRGDRTARVLLASVAAAAAALLLVFTRMQPFLMPSYVIGVSPVVVLLVAHGLGQCLPQGRWVGGFLVVACLVGTVALRLENLKDDYRAVVPELARAFAPGDAVVVITGTPEFFSQAGLRYYLGARTDVLAAIRDVPAFLEQLERGTLPPMRVQVLYRSRHYAAPTLQRLQAKAQLLHEGGESTALQHLTFAVSR